MVTEPAIDTELRATLLAMGARHPDLLDPDARHGVLFAPEDPREQQISDEHADRLAAIVDAHGWPGRALVGDEGALAAWAVAMHATGRPALLNAWTYLVERAAHDAQTERHHIAHLMDRDRILRGKEQVFATQLRHGPDGALVPYPYARPDTIDDRRGSVFLDPLDETLARLNAHPEAP